MSKGAVIKNKKLSLRMQKFSLRLDIVVFFCNASFLTLRQDLLTLRRKYLNEILSNPRSLIIPTIQNQLKLSKSILVLSFFSQNEN